MSKPSETPSRTEFQGQAPELIDRVVNLMDPSANVLLNMSPEQASQAVRSGDAEAVRRIRGQFAICEQSGKTIRMARSIGRPMRYFLAKRAEGPALVVAERMDQILEQLKREGLADQFHPAYTRMVPAHYLLELQLVGCPDPNPRLTRYFAPERNRLPADVNAIGAAYIERLAEVVDQFLVKIPADEPIGVMFSGGVDSGSILILVDYLLRRRGESSSRIKAFSLAVEGKPEDVQQSRAFLKDVNLEMLLEPIEVAEKDIRWQDAIASIEDYKPLDVQSATMGYALLREIRNRYPDWRYLIDGDGGDENLKDYPIEENPELTIRSVLGNRMLYQEGWGVDAVKHSLVYSGGQSRGHSRTSAPAAQFGFIGFSPYAVPDVIEIAEAVPFVALTDWDHEKLYSLKGQIVAAGIRQLTGVEMPVYKKRRFQHGAADQDTFQRLFPSDKQTYRDEFARMVEAKKQTT
ncbi:asparagine synthetase B family protein [Roseiconus nitratireducens]|uniref:Asparagine synthetase B family protein n=1 Tax=Roseiconus nitratireducens TaxID=2605748 RepID=A0A5M6CZH1_9BACT|nr:asparagine synthase-related protein [Roseiconus nitratireducens]KAA5540621.1 asparagine synthetase B family protein [Roseiconus nitratireducens]